MKPLVSSSVEQLSTLLEMIQRTGYTPHSEMMDRLGVKRTELCDILLELSANGFVFDAHPHAGVHFFSDPELLTPQLIIDRMSTEKIGRNIHHSFAAASTNSTAIELARKDSSEGALVVAEYQERGRGRFGRGWYSTPFSSILATLVLRPLPTSSTPMVVLAAASSIVESLRALGLEAYIEWPNDVVVEGKKICGILTESGADYTVCGFGLNVNQGSFMRSLATQATSVRKELRTRHSRPRLLRSILENFEENYDRLLSGETVELVERAREKMNSRSRHMRLVGRSDLPLCEISDIGEPGSLAVRQSRGHTVSIFPQEISSLLRHPDRDSGLGLVGRSATGKEETCMTDGKSLSFRS